MKYIHGLNFFGKCMISTLGGPVRGPKTYGIQNSLIWCVGSCRPNLEHNCDFHNILKIAR